MIKCIISFLCIGKTCVQREKMDSQSIADKIISSVTSWGLNNIDNLIGQGYDRAAMMSSSKKCVQAKLGTIKKSNICSLPFTPFGFSSDSWL